MVDRYRNYRPYISSKKPQKRSHRGVFKVVAVCIGIVVLARVWGHFTGSSSNKNTSVASKTAAPKKVVKAEPIPADAWNQLNKEVTAIIDTNKDLDISVTVIDINSNTKGSYGLQDNFAGASTTKVLSAVTFLHSVEQGKHSLTETVNGLTAQRQLKQMINQSSNDSWAAINDALGHTTLDSYAHSLGMSSYNATQNVVTANDEALLLQKLYSSQLLNDSHQKLLLSYMQNTNNEDLIPKVKPVGATLYHKYGQLEGRLHDTAIVDYQGRPITLVIYTKGDNTTDGSVYASRSRLIQDLAQIVFKNIYNT